MSTNPRLLKEITEYRDLLNARDDALRVVNEVLGMDQDTIDTNLMPTLSITLRPKTPGAVIQSRHFNDYLAKWLKKNIKTMANQVIAIVDAEIAANKTEAQQEAGLLGIQSSPIIVQPPVINSALTGNADLGSTFIYQATATHTSDPGVTSVVWACDDLPDGASIEANTGKITWNVPWNTSTSESTRFTVKVTTNAGTDSKQVSITVVVPESSKPKIESGQSISGQVGHAVTPPYQVKGTGVKVGENGVTSAVWSATGLPSNVGIAAETGIIQGALHPGTDSGSPYTVNVKVVTNFGTATETITMTVTP